MTQSLEPLKLLSAKTVNLKSVPGGIPELTFEMVAVALGYGKLSEMASLYCRIKYQIQHNIRHHLESYILVHHVLEWAIDENWVAGAGIFPKLGKVALDEMLSDNICKVCKGNKTVLIMNKKVICHPCGGTGHKRFSDREIARRLGIDNKHYSRTWKARYSRVTRVYFECEDEIAQCLGRLG